MKQVVYGLIVLLIMCSCSRTLRALNSPEFQGLMDAADWMKAGKSTSFTLAHNVQGEVSVGEKRIYLEFTGPDAGKIAFTPLRHDGDGPYLVYFYDKGSKHPTAIVRVQITIQSEDILQSEVLGE